MNKLGVVGCGLMGSGIAEVGAKGGCDVIVVDAIAPALDSAKERMRGQHPAPGSFEVKRAGGQ